MNAADILRLALCQLDPTVGDIAGNERAIADALGQARAAGAQVALFGELALTGYPPEDLLYKRHFLAEAQAARRTRRDASAQGIVAVVGFPQLDADVFNAAAILADGAIQAVYRKIYLPNYGVFDEQRYFRPGAGAGLVELGPHRVGITICEDIWHPGSPCADVALAGATLVLNISASPYHAGKGASSAKRCSPSAPASTSRPSPSARRSAGRTSSSSTGTRASSDHTGALVARAAQFREEILVCEVDMTAPAAERLRYAGQRAAASRNTPQAQVLARLELPPATGPAPAARVAALLVPREAEIYEALLCGVRDYTRKNGFTHVVLGLSGRDRLGAGCRDRDRCARAGARQRGRDAL